MSAVILTGFMGTGKTTIGRLLAERLHQPFIDTDARIEQLEGATVATIFAQKGEPYFRQLERRVVADALTHDAVVATGGGAIVDPENCRRMRAAGAIICLSAAVDVILERTAGASRPLLPPAERRARICELLAARAAAYAQADLTVDTSSRSAQDVAQEIIAFLRQRAGAEGPVS